MESRTADKESAQEKARERKRGVEGERESERKIEGTFVLVNDRPHPDRRLASHSPRDIEQLNALRRQIVPDEQVQVPQVRQGRNPSCKYSSKGIAQATAAQKNSFDARRDYRNDAQQQLGGLSAPVVPPQRLVAVKAYCCDAIGERLA